METWTFKHPEHGLIEVERGFDTEFRGEDPAWPQDPPTDDEGEVKPVNDPPVGAGIIARLEALRDNPPLRLQVKVNGEVRRRLNDVPTGRIPLQRNLGDSLSTISQGNVQRDKPHLHVQSNMFDDVLAVDYREGSQVVEFDPPAGSRGEARKKAMESSQFKRVAIPLATGLGKGGWALAILVLGPLLARFIGWLLSFLPDFELPSLPPLPDITLPVPDWPDISIPVPDLPDFNFPDITVPDWVLFLIEYSKVWIPILIGIVVGVIAVRNHRKSEQQKQQWQGVGPADRAEDERLVAEDSGSRGQTRTTQK